MTDVSKLATKKFNHDTVPLRTYMFASTSKLNISKKKKAFCTDSSTNFIVAKTPSS
jgi:hypothetical protein